MFDIIFQTTSTQMDKTAILLTCFAGNITIFAFGYPYIYRAISNLSNISPILTDRAKKHKLRCCYPGSLIGVFILNATSLIWVQSIPWCVLSVIILLFHIFYVICLYKIIDNIISEPFNVVKNQKIHEQNSQLINENELENDIRLIIDLICYSEKATFSEPDLSKYFKWLIDTTFLKFNKFDVSRCDPLLGITSEDADTLFSTIYQVHWLNQWAVNEKKINLLFKIENFYSWLLEYGIPHPKNFNNTAFPLLSTAKNTEGLIEEYKKETDVNKKRQIQNQLELIKRIQETVLVYFEQAILYRIKRKTTSLSEANNFVNLLYFIIGRRLKNDLKTQYEPCFNIICKMIDYDYSSEYYNEILRLIPKHRDYFWGEPNSYEDICGFHINVMSYFIFKNQYQKLKSYMDYEESSERTTQHTRPQIPNTINNIIGMFIGNASVFNNTETFSANVSALKYKFYVLFLMLINSKKFADDNQQYLLKLDKNNWNYEFVENEVKYHSEFNMDFSDVPFDDLMSYLTISNYKEHFECFKKEAELLSLFDYDKEDEKFIKKILDDVDKKVETARKNLLKVKMAVIAKKDFSILEQKMLGVKNLEELLNLKLALVMKLIKKLKFSCENDSNLKILPLNLFDKNYDKKKFLSGDYQRIQSDFYRRLFDLLVNNCRNISSISDIKNIENYEILSNIQFKNSFIEFGFAENEIVLKPTVVNGKIEENFLYADVQAIKTNGLEIVTSEYNYNFYSLNRNGENPSTIIFFDPTKISMALGDGLPVQFIDLSNGEIQIVDNTKITVKIPNDKSLGYFISNNKEDA